VPRCKKKQVLCVHRACADNARVDRKPGILNLCAISLAATHQKAKETRREKRVIFIIPALRRTLGGGLRVSQEREMSSSSSLIDRPKDLEQCVLRVWLRGGPVVSLNYFLYFTVAHIIVCPSVGYYERIVHSRGGMEELARPGSAWGDEQQLRDEIEPR
jgi:hypothetical protein